MAGNEEPGKADELEGAILERLAEEELGEWADDWADRLADGDLKRQANRLRHLAPAHRRVL